MGRRRPAILLAAAIAAASTTVAGCNEHPVALDGGVVALSVTDPAMAVGPSGWVSGSFALTIRDKGRRRVSFLPCAVGLERLGEDGWIGVWRQACLLNRAPREVSLLPGQSQEIVVSVGGQLGQGLSGTWLAPIAGDYRATVYASAEGALTLGWSGPFRLH